MCGIAGIFAYGAGAPPVDEEELLHVRDAMVRRGPDGEGLWIAQDGRIGLAHRRLAIIDLSADGAQPMARRPLGRCARSPSAADRARGEAMGANGRRMLESRFSRSRAIAAWESLLREATR